jgi:hypothetical protein
MDWGLLEPGAEHKFLRKKLLFDKKVDLVQFVPHLFINPHAGRALQGILVFPHYFICWNRSLSIINRF